LEINTEKYEQADVCGVSSAQAVSCRYDLLRCTVRGLVPSCNADRKNRRYKCVEACEL